MDEMEFQEADKNVRDLITEYQDKQDAVLDERAWTRWSSKRRTRTSAILSRSTRTSRMPFSTRGHGRDGVPRGGQERPRSYHGVPGQAGCRSRREGMDEMEFQEADKNVRDLITEYQDKQ